MNMFEELEKKYDKKADYVFKELYESNFWPFIVSYFDWVKMNAAVALSNIDLDNETHKAAQIQGRIQGLEYLGMYVKSCIDNIKKREEEE